MSGNKIKNVFHMKLFSIILLFFLVFSPLMHLSAGPLKENDEIIGVQKYHSISVTSDLIEFKSYDKALVPTIMKTITIPGNARNIEISSRFTNQSIFQLNNTSKFLNHPVNQPKNKQFFINASNQKMYNIIDINNLGKEINNLYDYSIGCGIAQGTPVLFITFHFYPYSVDSSSTSATFPQHIDISITYDRLLPALGTNIQKDLVIICPQEFKDLVQPLADHKNSIGIRTTTHTTEDIYQEYSGRDLAEQIKFFIKDAIEQWNISYVLLVGGHQGQTDSWYVPVRYSNLHDRGYWNDSYVSDLYFADIYRYNKTTQTIEFEDWDANKNDVFGEWTWIYNPERQWWDKLDKKDDLDLYPDVAVGRLACRNPSEVKHVVDKIISYETTSYNTDWFHRIILCGGDTFPSSSNGICEGELENALASSYLEPLGFDPIKLWVSTGTLTGPIDILRELEQGAGFFYLSGHGTPREWCTHPVSNDYQWIDLYSIFLSNIGNSGKLPVTVVGGCHNSQFDVGLYRINHGISSYGWSYFRWEYGIENFFKWTWVPTCWSWNLVSKKDEGSIAVIGNTGLGYGVSGNYCTEYSEGYMTTNFFRIYASLAAEGDHQLGKVHTETLNHYISHFSANDDYIDRKTVEQWVLLGDPSLYIGGYSLVD